MRTFKSYVNSYWQQVQEWKQDSSAVINSRPHSQWPQLIGPRRTSGLLWAKGSLSKILWTSEKVSLWWQGFDMFNSGAVGISDFCCWCLVAKSCPTLCDPMDLSMPGFPVLHYLLEFSQTHVHWVSDVIQTSHPLSSPSPPAFQSFPALGSFLTNWVIVSGGQNIGTSASASVFSMNIQNWFPLGLTGFITLLSKEFLRVFSNSTV